MKATFLRVSEGGKIAVSGKLKPFDYPFASVSGQSFSDSFVDVSNKQETSKILADLSNKGNGILPGLYWGTEGLYPIQGLEFEVKETCSVGYKRLPICEDVSKCLCVHDGTKVKHAIVSLVEPSKEEKYEEREKLFPQWNHEYPAGKEVPQDMERLGEKTNLELRKPITFDDLIKHGLANGANVVDGFPWSWKINGKSVTHENNRCYLIDTIHGIKKFTPSDRLMAFEFGLDVWSNYDSGYDTHAPAGCPM